MAGMTTAGAGDGLQAGDITAIAFIVDQGPSAGERGRTEIIAIPAHRIASRVANTAIDAFDRRVGGLPRRRVRFDLRDRIVSGLRWRKDGFGLVPFLEERLHVGGEVLDHRQILERTDFKLAAAGDLGDMGAAGPARLAVDRHGA